MKIFIPVLKQDTTNLFSSNFSFSKDILYLEKGQFIRSGKFEVEIEAYSESSALINNVFMYCQNSVSNFALFTNEEPANRDLFSEVFVVENMNKFSLAVEYSEFLKSEVFSKFPNVFVTKFSIEFTV